MMSNGGFSFIYVGCPCCSVQHVIAGDNGFSIIHNPSALYGEYCYTATICLDLISWGRDGAMKEEGEGSGSEKMSGENNKIWFDFFYLLETVTTSQHIYHECM